jgi:hypothetical protein
MTKWELSPYFLSQWQDQGKLFIPYCGVVVESAKPEHVSQIVELTTGNAALVGVNTPEKATQTISEFVAGGRGLVALKENEVVSFQGLGLWAFGFCELRSARTKPEWEGNGINMTMKKLMIHVAYERFGRPFIGFTEAASGSRGILGKLGFRELPMKEVHMGLAAACPSAEESLDKKDHCALRNGGDCGCKVYLLDINKEENGPL